MVVVTKIMKIVKIQLMVSEMTPAPQDHVFYLVAHVLKIVPLKGGWKDSATFQVDCNTLRY